MEDSNRFKVRLESYSHGADTTPTSSIMFNVMPSVVESIAVEYQAMDPLHMPGSYYVYKGTKARTFDLQDLKFVSRNPVEATANQASINILRGWTRPYFGAGSELSNVPKSNAATIGAVAGGNQYKVQDKAGSSTATGTGLRVLNTDEIKGILNTRELNKNSTSTIDGGRVKHYVTATDSKRTNTTPQEIAYLNSSAVQKEVTRVLDNMDANTAKNLKLRNAGDSNIATHSIIKIPAGTASAPVQNKSSKTAAQARAQKFLGAPPDVLYLTAYSDSRDTGGTLDKVTNIFRIPVVITALSITFPNDVDYIPTVDGQPFPIIMSISLSLVETHSPREFEKFDIFKYRDGLLPGF